MAETYKRAVDVVVGTDGASLLTREALLMVHADLRKNGAVGRPGVVWDGPLPAAPTSGKPGNPRVTISEIDKPRLEFSTVVALAECGVDMDRLASRVDASTAPRVQTARLIFGTSSVDPRENAIRQAFWSIVPYGIVAGQGDVRDKRERVVAAANGIPEDLARNVTADLSKAWDAGTLKPGEIQLSAESVSKLAELGGTSMRTAPRFDR